MIRNHRSPTRRATGPDRLTVEAVWDRAGGRCEISGVPLSGVRGEDFHVHHRRPRRMGGSRDPETNDVENLLLLSPEAHEHVERNRSEAYERGWLVRQEAIPAAVPVVVLVGGQVARVLLTDDAQYRPVEDVDLPEVG
jgi:5-methylcytosine-specific restriction protein A